MAFIKPAHSFGLVRDVLTQAIAPRALMAAMRLKLFDPLAEGPLTVSALADKLGAVEDCLEALLELLVAVGLVEKHGNQYANTAVATEFLVSTASLYQGLGMELTMDFVAGLEDSIADLVAGKDVDREKTDNKWGVDEAMEGAAQNAMRSALVPVVETIAALPGFDDFRAMCDIGGNHGLYTFGVLERHPTMSGVIYDLPHVAKQAQMRSDAAGYAGRITAMGLDFRTDDLPAGKYDLAMTSHVLYAFKHDLTTAISRIGEGLKPGGWFVSHHYSGRNEESNRLTKSSLELITRLSGYPSHFIEQDEFVDALSVTGFEGVRFQPVTAGGFGLITTARKKT